MARRDELRGIYELILMLQKDYMGGKNDPTFTKWIKRKRSEIRSINNYYVDPLEKSMKDEWRHRYDEDGEGGVDYAFFEDCGETDEEVEDFIMYSVGYPEINSPYDCTGRRFTYGVDWKRMHGGIVMIHRWGLDV